MAKKRSITSKNISAINSKIRTVSSYFSKKSAEYEKILSELKISDFDFYMNTDGIIQIKNTAKNRLQYQKIAVLKKYDIKKFVKKSLKEYSHKTNVKKFKSETTEEYKERFRDLAESAYKSKIISDEYYRIKKEQGVEAANLWYDTESENYWNNYKNSYEKTLADIADMMSKHAEQRANGDKIAIDDITGEITDLSDIPNFNKEWLT